MKKTPDVQPDLHDKKKLLLKNYLNKLYFF